MMGDYISTYKYSSIDLVKDMLEFAGIPKEPKTEEKRLTGPDRFWRRAHYRRMHSALEPVNNPADNRLRDSKFNFNEPNKQVK